MSPLSTAIKGRGTPDNPANRFKPINYVPVIEDDWEVDDRRPQTQYFKDASKTALSHFDSPDLGFSVSLNPYRGCEHGCIYCYARPTHEYLDMSSGLDFETKIMVKEDAPELLRRELFSSKWQPQVITLSGVTDPYQPIERKLEITRRCLQVLVEFRNPVVIITKNHLVQRDCDLLQQLAAQQAAAVFCSIPTLDPKLRQVLGPRTSHPQKMLETLKILTAAGIPCGVMCAPVIPGLTEHEMPQILKEAAGAGAVSAGYVMLRLPYQLKELFINWLERHFPDRKDKVLNRIRDIRGGKLYDGRWGVRFKGEGFFAEQIAQIFRLSCQQNSLNRTRLPLSSAAFQLPGKAVQLKIF